MPTARPFALAALSALLAAVAAPFAVACDRCPARPGASDSARFDTATLLHDLDRRTAAAGAARPTLVFPARVGVARLEDGQVTAIPADEWAAWRTLRDQLSPQVAELSPVSAIVAQSLTTTPLSSTPHDAITHLRLAAAREQLDAILLYEITTTQSLEQTELSLLDATIVGAWWFPVHKSHLAAHASATLIDVRSGLAYGSAIGNASDVCSASLLGSEEKRVRQRHATVRKSVAALAPEVGSLLARVAQAPRNAAPRTTAPAPLPSAPAPARAPGPSHVETDRGIPPPADNGGADFWGANP